MRPEERRKSPRVVVDLPVRLGVEGQTVPGRIHDVCRDAALVETHQRCAVGTRVALAWESDGGGMVQVAGVVLRVSVAEGDARRVAILFVDVAPATATAIELLVHRAGTDS
jgi:PilZ domain-containing protein